MMAVAAQRELPSALLYAENLSAELRGHFQARYNAASPDPDTKGF